MTPREWTGSCAVLPESMREFATSLIEHGHATNDSFCVDHASTLREWADAVEQLYVKRDAVERVAMQLLDALGLRHALASIVDYNYADEEEDFVRNHIGPEGSHVFEHLQRVSDLLTSVSP